MINKRSRGTSAHYGEGPPRSIDRSDEREGLTGLSGRAAADGPDSLLVQSHRYVGGG
jgi:hypothetical protein